MAGRCDGLVVLGRTVADEVVERLADRGAPLVARRPPPDRRRRLGQRREPRAPPQRSADAPRSTPGARPIAFVGDPDVSPDVAERLAPASAAGADGERTGAVVQLIAVEAWTRTAGAGVAAEALRTPTTSPTPSSAPTTSSPSA